MENAIPHRRGDTFRVAVTVENDDGAPFDLTGFGVEALLETPGGHVLVEFTPTIAAVEGGIILSAPLSVSDLWPVGHHAGAIRLTAPSGDRLTSPTFFVAVLATPFDEV